MENNDDSEIAIMSMQQFVIEKAKECHDIKTLDLVYRIFKLNAEGRAN